MRRSDPSRLPAWTEFVPDFGEFKDFQHFETTGSGPILRRLYRGPDVPIRLAMTTDGVDWSELRLPDGFHVADLSSDADASIDIAGDRWVAFGWDVTRAPHENVGREVWFSDDEGSSWTQATIEVPSRSEPLPPYAIEESAVLEALAWGDRLVVVVRTSTRLDLEALLTDRGLMPAGQLLNFWAPSRRGFTLTFVEELPADDEPGRRGRARWRQHKQEMSHEDLALSAPQAELVRKRQDTVIRIYSGDGPSLPLRAEYERWAYKVTGVASAEGIVLATQGDRDALLTSTDGIEWSEQPLGTVELWATGGDGALWAAARSRRGTRIDRIAHHGRTTAAFLEDASNLCNFAAGPAGVVVAALTGDSARKEPGLMRTKVRKAGRTYTQSGHGDYRADEVWVGWSPDGEAWGWQPASEAFGVDPRRRVSVRMAVGDDFVIAEVSDYGYRLGTPLEGVRGPDAGLAAGWHAVALPHHTYIARVR